MPFSKGGQSSERGAFRSEARGAAGMRRRYPALTTRRLGSKPLTGESL